jgi:hypothetical protein
MCSLLSQSESDFARVVYASTSIPLLVSVAFVAMKHIPYDKAFPFNSQVEILNYSWKPSFLGIIRAGSVSS